MTDPAMRERDKNWPRIASGDFWLPEHPRPALRQSSACLRARKRRCRSRSMRRLRFSSIAAIRPRAISAKYARCLFKLSSSRCSAGVRRLSDTGKHPFASSFSHIAGLEILAGETGNALVAAVGQEGEELTLGVLADCDGVAALGHVIVSVLMPPYNATSRYGSNAKLRYGENNTHHHTTHAQGGE